LANYRSNNRKKNAQNKSTVPEQVTKVRTPRQRDNEVFATVSSLLGANRVRLQCMDGIIRMGRIPGSKKKKYVGKRRRSGHCYPLGSTGFKSRCNLEIYQTAGRLAFT